VGRSHFSPLYFDFPISPALLLRGSVASLVVEQVGSSRCGNREAARRGSPRHSAVCAMEAITDVAGPSFGPSGKQVPALSYKMGSR